jgi:hypothetical protein
MENTILSASSGPDFQKDSQEIPQFSDQEYLGERFPEEWWEKDFMLRALQEYRVKHGLIQVPSRALWKMYRAQQQKKQGAQKPENPLPQDGATKKTMPPASSGPDSPRTTQEIPQFPDIKYLGQRFPGEWWEEKFLLQVLQKVLGNPKQGPNWVVKNKEQILAAAELMVRHELIPLPPGVRREWYQATKNMMPPRDAHGMMMLPDQEYLGERFPGEWWERDYLLRLFQEMLEEEGPESVKGREKYILASAERLVNQGFIPVPPGVQVEWAKLHSKPQPPPEPELLPKQEPQPQPEPKEPTQKV